MKIVLKLGNAISVFIPIYKESRFLPEIINNLVIQEFEKEIFVIVDEPSEETLKIAKKFGDHAVFVFNKERVGKANALNEVVKLSSGKILLFLDADVEIPDDPDFLHRIHKGMNNDVDILDIKKEVIPESFLSRLTYYEYVGFNICTWLMAKFAGKCPAVNGAAFAMKRNIFDSLEGFRNVISEDLDIATRAFLKNYKFSYLNEAKVRAHVKSNIKDLMGQRNRWTTGGVLWLKEWNKDLWKEGSKQPHISFPLLILLFPSSIFVILNPFLPYIIEKSMLSNFLIIVGINFFIITLSFFILSKKLAFEFKIHEFLIYLFFYSFFNIFFMMAGFIKVFILNKIDVLDWKI